MRLFTTTGIAAAALVAAQGAARADGYCDHAEGVAAAESALLFAPQLFGSFGYVDQPDVVAAPDATSDSLRFTAGVKITLTGLYEGALVKKRAKADCRRHAALDAVEGETTYRALEAKAKVLDAALDEATAILEDANADLERRRATAQEVTATRLRVDELRDLAADTRAQLEALPPPGEGRSMARALDVFQDADAEVERTEGKLRRARAWDVSVRIGYDKFLENDDDESPFFGVVSIGFNLGWFLQGKANQKAASGRRKLVEEESAEIGAGADQLRALLEIEKKREEESGVLVGELERQLAKLKKIEGEDSRQFRQTIWFSWVKAKADHEYLVAHVASLEEILGEETEK